MKELLTISEAATHLSIKPDTLRRWVYARKIGVVRMGQKILRIPKAEIDRLTREGFRPAIGDGSVLPVRRVK